MAPDRRSLNVWVELTERCQYRCRFCYNYWRSTPPATHQQMSEHTLRLLTRFLSDASQTFTVTVALAGGDATAHAEYVTVTRQLAACAHDICLVTHGGSLDTDALLELRHVPHLSIQFSIPSLHPEHYKFLTGGFTLDRVLTSMAQCEALGIPISMSVVVTSMNLADMPPLVDLAAQFGARYVVLNRFIAAGRGELYAGDFEVAVDRFDAAVAEAREAARARGVRLLASGNNPRIRGVKAQHPKITVGVDGQVRVCSLSEVPLGNLECSAADLVDLSTAFWTSTASLSACQCSQVHAPRIALQENAL